jgi:hypothetical protein
MEQVENVEILFVSFREVNAFAQTLRKVEESGDFLFFFYSWENEKESVLETENVWVSVCPTNQKAAIQNKRGTPDFQSKIEWDQLTKHRKSESWLSIARNPIGQTETNEK